MKFRYKHFSRVYRDPDPGVDGGGADASIVADAGASGSVADTAPPANSIEGGMAAMFPAASAGPEGETPEAKAERLRDEGGRYAKKPELDPKSAAVDPNAPTKKPDGKDGVEKHAMPEGLSPKGQERFQALANENKELTAAVTAATQIAGSPEAIVPMLESAKALQTTFQEHGVRREQFDQGMQVIGMINRGDLAGAQKVMEEQLRLISLATGRPIGAVDALAGFPDLRERVDSLQISEADAMELARNRTHQSSQQQQQQRQQQEQQYQQREQQAVQGGQLAVDKFCKSRMTSDLDYAKIEPVLLKEIRPPDGSPGLLDGIPPQRWAQIVEKTYNLIKQTGGASTTQQQAGGGGVLRPSGAGAVKGVPQNGFEAMFGSPAPTGYRE